MYYVGSETNVQNKITIIQYKLERLLEKNQSEDAILCPAACNADWFWSAV